MLTTLVLEILLIYDRRVWRLMQKRKACFTLRKWKTSVIKILSCDGLDPNMATVFKEDLAINAKWLSLLYLTLQTEVEMNFSKYVGFGALALVQTGLQRLLPQGFGPEAKTRTGTLGFPACIHSRNFKIYESKYCK